MPRTSPTIGMSRSESSIARNAPSCSRTCSLRSSLLEHVEVRQRDRRGDRVAAERDAVRERVAVAAANGSKTRSEAITAPIGAYEEVMPLAVVMMSGW